MMTTSPRRNHGTRQRFTYRRNTAPFTLPRWVIRRGRSPSRMAPIRDTVFQLRPGREPAARVPRVDQACSRHIPVLQYDSSMKTSRLAFIFVEAGAEFATKRSPLGAVALRRHERLFFREKPRRCRARWTAERLVEILARFCSAAVSSSTVASDIVVTICVSSSAIRPWIGDLRPPPLGSGSTCLVLRYRASTRFTVA